MRTSEKKTFFVYSQGTSPRVLTLGSLVVEDYANPTLARHYFPLPLNDAALENVATITQIRNFVFQNNRGLHLGLNIDAAEVASTGIGWNTRRESIIYAPKGKRVELVKPDEFLNTVVLADPGIETNHSLKLWLTASSAEYYGKGKFWRTPHIWMLTGYYVLENVKVLEVESKDHNLSAGISSAIIAAASGVPVGGAFDVGKDLHLRVGMLVEKAHVWAAQYQKLDANYIRVTSDTKEPAVPKQFSLLDKFSVGQVRAGTESPNAATMSLQNNAYAADAEILGTQEELEYLTQLEDNMTDLENQIAEKEEWEKKKREKNTTKSAKH